MGTTNASKQSTNKQAVNAAALIIFFVALNLRPAIVAVGPLLSQIGADLQWGESLQGLLGAIPLLAFAAFSLLVHFATERIGADSLLVVALAVLGAGCLLRSGFGEAAVWAGTVLVGAAIAVGNVLAPVIVKRDFPQHISFATGAYSACVTAGSAIAGLTAAAAAEALGGWRGALAFWAAPAFLAAVLWVLRLRVDKKARAEKRNAAASALSAREAAGGRIEACAANESKLQAATTSGATTGEIAASNSGQSSAPGIKDASAAESKTQSLWRRPSTWWVTLYMGLQSTLFYTFSNWLPSLAMATGFTATEAGIQLFIFQALGIVSGLLIPRFMYTGGNQVCAGLLASVPAFIACLGWLFAPGLSFVWCVVGGMGQGASLVVALTLISLRGRTHAETIALSGGAQSFGYLLASCGPFAFGSLLEFGGGYAAPLVMTAAVALALCLVSFPAGKIPPR